MADPYVAEGRMPVEVTVAIAVTAGDLLAWNGSAWVKADADTPSLYARLIAGASVDGSINTRLTGFKEAIVVDSDAPYTVGDKVYLSQTAGAHTATRPTGGGVLRQVVGQVLATDTVHLACADPREVTLPIVVTGATSALAVLDAGDFGGPTLDAQNEVCTMFCAVPENAVGVAAARLYLAAEASLGTPQFTLSVSSALDGEQWDAVAADTLTGQALEGAAADEIEVLSIAGALDGANIVRPGCGLGLKATKSDAGTDVSFIFGGAIAFNCV